MTTIGQFTLSKDGGWIGTIRTLTINAKVRLIPNDNRDQNNAPLYRLMLGHNRIGDAWAAEIPGDDGYQYLRVRFDDPVLPQPITAALFFNENGTAARLVWSRKQQV